jgi:hypothetical protein
MERWIAARTPLTASFELATDVLVDDALSVLPDGAADGRGGMFVDLSVGVGSSAGVHQDVDVTLGSPCVADGEAWVPISWVPAAHARLLPTFDGVIEIVDGDDAAELSLTGLYRIPLGIAGRFGDGVVGRRAAQQSLRMLVQRMAAQIDGLVAERLRHASPASATRAVELRERAAPTP